MSPSSQTDAERVAEALALLRWCKKCKKVF
eukprot:SAG22_NODE_15257_length_353_cov_0.811024_1_plen_29_part_10